MGPVCDAPAGGPNNVQRIHGACNRLRLALGQLQRADSGVPNDWERPTSPTSAATGRH